MRLAFTVNDILTSEPWSQRRVLKARSQLVYVMDATNQPKEGKIKYWLYPKVPHADWALDAFGYGVAAYAEDVEFTGFDYNAPTLERLEELCHIADTANESNKGKQNLSTS